MFLELVGLPAQVSAAPEEPLKDVRLRTNFSCCHRTSYRLVSSVGQKQMKEKDRCDAAGVLIGALFPLCASWDGERASDP